MKLKDFIELNNLRETILIETDSCVLCRGEIKKCYTNKHPNTYFCKNCVESTANEIINTDNQKNKRNDKF